MQSLKVKVVDSQGLSVSRAHVVVDYRTEDGLSSIHNWTGTDGVATFGAMDDCTSDINVYLDGQFQGSYRYEVGRTIQLIRSEKGAVLRVVVVSPRNEESATAHFAFKRADEVADLEEVSSLGAARELILNEGVNALVIDLVGCGVKRAIELIELIRHDRPAVPICLLGTFQELRRMPGVPKKWKSRLEHYYSIPIDSHPADLILQAEHVAALLLAYWLSHSAKAQLQDLRDTFSSNSLTRNATQSNDAQTDVIVYKLQTAIKAIELKSVTEQPTQIVPGFERKDVQDLVKQTLESTSTELKNSARFNKATVSCAGLLVAISFIVTIVNPTWEPALFGGFGIAGLITSLIVNPLKSIEKGAQRLMQIQIAYLSFLNQVSILNKSVDESSENHVEVSKQLDAVTKNLQSDLGKLAK